MNLNAMSELEALGLIAMVLFLILGTIDGVYFHLIKYKLYKYQESRFEHQIHGIRGALLGIVVIGLMLRGRSDIVDTVFGTAVFYSAIVIDLCLEIVDIYVERSSRKALGGVSSSEMVLHVFASSFRMVGLVLLIVSTGSKPVADPIASIGVLIGIASAVIGLGSLFLDRVLNGLRVFADSIRSRFGAMTHTYRSPRQQKHLGYRRRRA